MKTSCAYRKYRVGSLLRRITAACLATAALLFLGATPLRGQELKDITPERKAQFDQLIEMAEVAEKGGDLTAQALCLSRASLILWESNRLYEAIETYQQAAEAYQKINDVVNLRRVYANIGTIYADLQEIDRAREYYDKGLEVARGIGQREQIASSLVDLAYLCTAMGQQEESNDKLTEAIDIALAINNQQLLQAAYGLMASNLEQMGFHDDAQDYRSKYDALLRLSKESAVKKDFQAKVDVVKADLRKVETEKQMQDSLLVLNQLLYEKSQESLQLAHREAEVRKRENEALTREAKLLDSELREKEAVNKAQTAELERKKAVEQHQRTLLVSAVVMLALMVAIAVIIIRNNIRGKRTNRQLESQKNEIEQQSVELQAAMSKIERQNQQIHQSINYAKGIQVAMTPKLSLLQAVTPDSFILWRPRDVVSGDFPWFRAVGQRALNQRQKGYGDELETDEERIERLRTSSQVLVTAVDCTGHGVPGAFMSMIGNNLLDEITERGVTRPDLVLEQLDRGIQTSLKQNVTGNNDGMDMALCLIDRRERKLFYAGANNPLLYVRDGEMTQIKGSMAPVGGYQIKTKRFELHEIPLDKPTTFYIFSDGYIDQFGGPLGRKFMVKNFRQLLHEISPMPFDEQRNILELTFNSWLGTEYPQIDDVLVIGFKIDLGPEPDSAPRPCADKNAVPEADTAAAPAAE